MGQPVARDRPAVDRPPGLTDAGGRLAGSGNDGRHRYRIAAHPPLTSEPADLTSGAAGDDMIAALAEVFLVSRATEYQTLQRAGGRA